MSTLIVEDDEAVCHLVRHQLNERGIHVTIASSVAEATAAIADRTFSVAILDLALPDGSGMEVLDLLHDASSDTHVIVLSGSSAEHIRVEALERGADDYVVKPFFRRELTARVLAVQRRQTSKADDLIHVGAYVIDPRSRTVTRDGEIIDLTARELDLLAYLAARPGQVFSREQLLNAVWRSSSDWQQPATVTEHIRRVRNKIVPEPGQPPILVSVRGVGYRLDLPPERSG
jgi:DNA-binding response OmpR family regulator